MPSTAHESRPVLIVEDDPATRLVLGSLFLRRGWRVRTAASVAEALDELGFGPEPEVLILDLGLPDGSGDAVLQAVREERLSTRIMILTGTTEPEPLRRARDMSPEFVLFKPIEFEVIARLCEQR